MTESDIAKLLDERFTRERVLNRVESHALKHHGLRVDAAEDMRASLERRAQAGEDLSQTPVADIVKTVRHEKPHYFSEPSRTSPATEGEPKKGVNGDGTERVDHTKSTRKDYASFLQKFAPGLRV